jgi:hypothetical protein
MCFCSDGTMQVTSEPDLVAMEPSNGGSMHHLQQRSMSMNTAWSRRANAVSVRHAFKNYGSKKNPNVVLSNLNMTVAKGTM